MFRRIQIQIRIQILIPFSKPKEWIEKLNKLGKEQMFYLPAAHKQTGKHTHAHMRRCQGDTHKCSAISAPNSFRWQRVSPFSPVFPPLPRVHTNFAASFSCYNITKKYIYHINRARRVCVWGRVDCLSKRKNASWPTWFAEACWPGNCSLAFLLLSGQFLGRPVIFAYFY